jgi:hypothetical protein
MPIIQAFSTYLILVQLLSIPRSGLKSIPRAHINPITSKRESPKRTCLTLIEEIRRLVIDEQFEITVHARERMAERGVSTED